ncbi:hypothetical protein DUNSADRAFT_9745 [Dunaliella salina]|uniref:Mitochondrial ribosomal protein L13 n=1 Tax=Dunaliella salina TaxID=3046 RepID=A0ABQ7GGS8_DUNSA|nr:hypothetical protein DUNSADRAFT_9745 [Dunaliella salina]|eukprot:KAF5833798.1 hypothetical protein DUNSADRAFT_9745 [Dunaliella salina]
MISVGLSAYDGAVISGPTYLCWPSAASKLCCRPFHKGTCGVVASGLSSPVGCQQHPSFVARLLIVYVQCCYPGGLKSRTADKLWEKDPTEILRKAVNGMLPKNKLRTYRLDKLKIFPEAQHPFEGLEMVPYVPKPRITSAPEISWPLPDGFTPMNAERFAVRALANRKYPPRRPIAGLESFNNLLNNEEMSLLEASIRQEGGGDGKRQ